MGAAEVMTRIRHQARRRVLGAGAQSEGFEGALAAKTGRDRRVFGAASEAFSQKDINCSIARSVGRFNRWSRRHGSTACGCAARSPARSAALPGGRVEPAAIGYVPPLTMLRDRLCGTSLWPTRLASARPNATGDGSRLWRTMKTGRCPATSLTYLQRQLRPTSMPAQEMRCDVRPPAWLASAAALCEGRDRQRGDRGRAVPAELASGIDTGIDFAGSSRPKPVDQRHPCSARPIRARRQRRRLKTGGLTHLAASAPLSDHSRSLVLEVKPTGDLPVAR